MTNEEKARDIAKDKVRLIKLYGGETQCEFDCQDAAIEMAEWKDEQFKNKVNEYVDIAYQEGSDAHLLEELLKDI